MTTNDFSIQNLVNKLSNIDKTILKPLEGKNCTEPLPSRVTLIQAVENLRAVLFPGYYGTSEINKDSIKYHIGYIIDNTYHILVEQVKRGLCFTCSLTETTNDCPTKKLAEKIVENFLNKLPNIREILLTDAIAAYENDPAATSPDEAIFCYPGFRAITNYRMAHELYLLEVPLLPRMITEHAHSRTGIDIHPAATIGSRFFIDHGTGVVIGSTSILGKNISLYQGVTLGAKSFPLDVSGIPIKGVPRHPILEDNVVVYAGATILGRVTIGFNSIIGGNVWLTHSVQPNSKILQSSFNKDEV